MARDTICSIFSGPIALDREVGESTRLRFPGATGVLLFLLRFLDRGIGSAIQKYVVTMRFEEA